ncbi:hypothetical protein JI667_19870 [Bacillus sp. NTK074B]|uniref:hypothetical protein n=1 Tax=Bacillus sp. NTK074B TaxID=2802174 RepID=UPI001A8F1C16|nr:hypothetical protein [Bacillus sp. NTK074B]
MQEKDRPEANASGLSLQSNKRGVIMNHSLYYERGGTLLFNENDFQYHCNICIIKSQHKRMNVQRKILVNNKKNCGKILNCTHS